MFENVYPKEICNLWWLIRFFGAATYFNVITTWKVCKVKIRSWLSKKGAKPPIQLFDQLDLSYPFKVFKYFDLKKKDACYDEITLNINTYYGLSKSGFDKDRFLINGERVSPGESSKLCEPRGLNKERI